MSIRRIADPYCRVSSENIERPAMSSARFCMAASRSIGWLVCAPSTAIASRAQVTMWRASTGRVRGASDGAMVRRCSRQSSPSLSSRPLPVIGRRMRIDAGERR